MTWGTLAEITVSCLGGLAFIGLVVWVGYHWLRWELVMNRMQKELEKERG